MHTHFEDISTRLFSPRVWRGFGAPTNMNPTGSSYQSPSGNPVFGFFDDFLTFSETTLVGPYAILQTNANAVKKVADTETRKGVITMPADGDTAEDEAVIKWGSTSSAPFRFGDKDLAFECCLSMSSITAAKWNIAVGLGQADMIATDGVFTDSDILADKHFAGFVKLVGEAGVFDGAYKATGATYQDGATKTKLNALATFSADVTVYKKLGLRYRAHPRTLEWYVDGVMPGGQTAPAKLTATELAATTFPNAATDFLAPYIALKDGAGNAALNMQVDWWACAQYE